MPGLNSCDQLVLGRECADYADMRCGCGCTTLLTCRLSCCRPANRWDAVPSTGMAYQCMHINETMLSPGPTFAAHLARTESTGSTGSTEGALRRRRHLQQPGAAAADHAPYAVGFFGKYLNISPRQAPTGAHTYFVNPGPEAGSAKDPTGEYYPSFWYQVVPSKGINTTWNNTEMQYETSLIAASATAWIAEVVAEDATRPFFLYAAPHAPHGAAIPAPEHAAAFGPTGLRAPITPSWNVSARDHHWLVAQQPPVRESEVLRGDQKFTQRWQCLLSVDELIGQLVDAVDAARATNNTYFIVTSDHGFHFHELRLGVGKWNVYVYVSTRTHARTHLVPVQPSRIYTASWPLQHYDSSRTSRLVS